MSVQTIDSKKDDFIGHAKKAFNEKNLNYARQAAEAFCKIIILKEDGENADESFQKYKKLEGKINYIVKKPTIQKKIKSYLIFLQNHGNLASHDGDTSKINEDDINDGLLQLSKLIDFLYTEYLHQDIPDKIKVNLLRENFESKQTGCNQHSKSNLSEKKLINKSLNNIEESNISVTDKKPHIEESINNIKNSTISIGS